MSPHILLFFWKVLKEVLYTESKNAHVTICVEKMVKLQETKFSVVQFKGRLNHQYIILTIGTCLFYGLQG